MASGIEGSRTKQTIELNAFLSSSADFVDPEARRRQIEEREREEKEALEALREEIRRELFGDEIELTDAQNKILDMEVLKRRNEMLRKNK